MQFSSNVMPKPLARLHVNFTKFSLDPVPLTDLHSEPPKNSCKPSEFVNKAPNVSIGLA